MPYIPHQIKKDLDPNISAVIERIRRYPDADLDGIVNYTITRIASESFKPENGWRYRIIARVIGAFEAAAKEFYRRVAGPYEDKAIVKNGDIKVYE